MRRISALTAAALAAAASLAQPAGADAPGGTTSLRLDPAVLASHGIALAGAAPSAPGLREGALGFRVRPGSALATAGGPGDVEGFAAADLRHAGGVALEIDGARLRFPGVALARAEPPHDLALRDADGRVQLLATGMHARLDAGGRALRVRHADLVFAPALAARLGRPELAGTYVGVLDADWTLASPPAAPGAAAQGGACSADFTLPVDVALIELTSLTMAAREAGVRVALAPRAVLRNVGQGDVAWNHAIAPDSPVGPHPFLSVAFYRLAGGAIEQLGLADAKHAFFATNTNCPCAGGHVLYVGCEDTYGVSTNLDRTFLAPRAEIDALARSWTSLGSHFDALPVDDFRDHPGGAHDAFEHRLVVREDDLGTPGARYFYDAWYLAAGDVDLVNSMGWREVAPAFGGSAWTFPTVDAGLSNGGVLDAWVDPQSPTPGAANALHDSGEGRVQLAVSTTDLGGGAFHYEYALHNFDFERRVESFRVPLAPGQSVSAVGFGDGDPDPANDWSASVGPKGVTWTAPPGAELDWGRLVGFRFDASAAPAATRAALGPAEGPPAAELVPTLGPAAAPVPGLGRWGALGAALALAAGAYTMWMRGSRARASSASASAPSAGWTA